MRLFTACAVMLITAPALCFAGDSYVVPTTTLSAQTANNTSAANSFASQSNGNLGASNISKVDVHSLLYVGNTTKVYAHMMLWFGGSGHMNVGYNSTNPTQVANQIDDMVSRGINGVIIDWYGPNNSIDTATQLVMTQAEAHPGFTFAIMVDQGAIEWDSCSGCSPQQALIEQLQYVESEYFVSPAYMKINNQPVVTNFNIDQSYSINWDTVNSSLSTKPLFLWQNNGGFTHVLAGGSYSWVMPTDSNYGMDYLSSFYDTGMGYSGESTVGASYKGFNDSLASWGSGRIMGQQCGATWLNTFAEVNGLYNSGKQLPDLQLVTWNDYEEGTEIESGIDNCLTLSGSISGNTLKWQVNGDSELDHYVAYISTDGENLMALDDNLLPGTTSLNLCSYSIPSGNYKLFVQAVGKPSMLNHMTGSLSYTPSCLAAQPPPANVALTASPASLTLNASGNGALQVMAKTQSGSFSGAIALSCSGLPSNLSCSFSPNSVSPGSGSASSTLTIGGIAVAGNTLPRRNSNPISGGWMLPFGIVGIALAGSVPRRRGMQIIALFAVLSVGMISTACGGGSQGSSASANSSTKSSTYTVTIHGSSGSSSLTTTVNVIVQ